MGCACCKKRSVEDTLPDEEIPEEIEPVVVVRIGKKDAKVIEEEPVEALKWTESERAFVNIWKTTNLTKSGDLDDTDFGECAVCFEPMSENKPTVMQDPDEKRSCRHFICYECAEDLLDSTKSCPLCRQSFEKIAALPSLMKSKDEWFRLVGGKNGQLTKQDVQLVLNAILPLSSSRIGMDLELEWVKWDPEGKGHLTKEQADVSICPYVQRKINMPRFQKGAIPDISKAENVGLWFDYWDWDNRGRLAKHEIARAMLKTFSQLLHGKRGKLKIKQMSETLLLDFWPVLELKDTNYIELDEFIAEDGLAQCIIQLLWDTMNKPPDKYDLIEMGLNEREFQLRPSQKKKRNRRHRKHVKDARAAEEKVFESNIQRYSKNNPDNGLLSRPSIQSTDLLVIDRLSHFGVNEHNQEGKALVAMLTSDQTEDPPPIDDLIGEDGLPRWWIQRRTPDDTFYYQNNFTQCTSWEPPTREQMIKEYNNGAGKWFRDRFLSHKSAKKRRIGDSNKRFISSDEKAGHGGSGLLDV